MADFLIGSGSVGRRNKTGSGRLGVRKNSRNSKKRASAALSALHGDRPDGPVNDVSVDNNTLASMATAASPAQPAPVEVRRRGTAIRDATKRTDMCSDEQVARVAVSYNGLTGAPVYESGLPYCSLDGLCPPEIIAEMRVKAYYTAMFAAEIAAGKLAAW
jgi:hypothetical protein